MARARAPLLLPPLPAPLGDRSPWASPRPQPGAESAARRSRRDRAGRREEETEPEGESLTLVHRPHDAEGMAVARSERSLSLHLEEMGAWRAVGEGEPWGPSSLKHACRAAPAQEPASGPGAARLPPPGSGSRLPAPGSGSGSLSQLPAQARAPSPSSRLPLPAPRLPAPAPAPGTAGRWGLLERERDFLPRAPCL